jgi:hypothetical protein
MSDDFKIIKARFSSKCFLCNVVINKGGEIRYYSVSKSVTCLECLATNSYGEAGKSAKDKALKIESKRKESVESIPIIGKFIYPFLDPSKEAQKWSKGADGEERVGSLLDELAVENNFIAIHDRKIPDSKANIDHMLVTPKGVFIIDAKNYKGLVELRKSGSFFMPGKLSLFVNGKNRDNLVEGVKWQVGTVKASLIDSNVPVVGVLAFTQNNWPWVGKPKLIDGVYLNSKGISEVINEVTSDYLIDVDLISKEILSIFKAN